MSIREERKQQSRQALLNAALQLSTSGRSFARISLREVTRQVGLVPTAFYRHFDDLDDQKHVNPIGAKLCLWSTCYD